MARIVEYAAVFHGNVIIRPFVDDVSAVLVGHTGFDAWLDVLREAQPGAHHVDARHFDQSGLAPWYQDTSGIGQLHHFWFHLHLAVFNGPGFAATANLIHDPPWSGNPGQGGNSLNDYVLGVMGVALGSALNARAISIYDIGEWIRDYLAW